MFPMEVISEISTKLLSQLFEETYEICVSILFIIPDPEVTFSFPWAVPPNKIDPFGSWSMMAFLLILTIGSLYEWKRGASDRE